MKAMALRFRLLCPRLNKYLNSTSVHLLFVIRIPHLQQWHWGRGRGVEEEAELVIQQLGNK